MFEMGIATGNNKLDIRTIGGDVVKDVLHCPLVFLYCQVAMIQHKGLGWHRRGWECRIEEDGEVDNRLVRHYLFNGLLVGLGDGADEVGISQLSFEPT